MTKHTQEPWTLGHEHPDDKYTVTIHNANGEWIAQSDEQHAARIASCVNSCSGINPEAVPEMIGALEGALAYLAPPASKFKENRDAAVEAIRAALAKARETH